MPSGFTCPRTRHATESSYFLVSPAVADRLGRDTDNDFTIRHAVHDDSAGPHDTIPANFDIRFDAGIQSDQRIRPDFHSPAQNSRRSNVNVFGQSTIVLDNGPSIDDGMPSDVSVRAHDRTGGNEAAGADNCIRRNDGTGMDHGGVERIELSQQGSAKLQIPHRQNAIGVEDGRISVVEQVVKRSKLNRCSLDQRTFGAIVVKTYDLSASQSCGLKDDQCMTTAADQKNRLRYPFAHRFNAQSKYW